MQQDANFKHKNNVIKYAKYDQQNDKINLMDITERICNWWKILQHEWPWPHVKRSLQLTDIVNML